MHDLNIFQISDQINHTLIKDPLKVWDRPMDFNITEYEGLIDVVSDSILQQIFKNY